MAKVFFGVLLLLGGGFLAFSCRTADESLEHNLRNALSDKPVVQKKESPLPAPDNLNPGQPGKEEFCKIINRKFADFGWWKIICNPERWKVYDHSHQGNPLLYQKFGFGNPENKGPVNLFLCGVHGNEPSAVYLCFHLVREILFDHPEVLKSMKLVVAPIVNPDGFLANTRVNGRGVDINRNLPTRDWMKSAMHVWKQYKKDPRKFPGDAPGSETESRFQAFLVQHYQPDKIISVHAPYGFLDFDGPGDRKYYNLVRVEQRAKFLALNIEENSKRFLRVVDFRFFPGSLGNYAGNERKIPTYTLELPSTNAGKAPYYWSVLRYALVKALTFRVYEGEGGNPFLRAGKLLKTPLENDPKKTTGVKGSSGSPLK